MPSEAQARAGRVLDILINRAHVSPREVADAIGASHTHVYNKIRGRAWEPRDTATFAQLFDVPDYLFEMDEQDAMLWLIQNDRFYTLTLHPLAGPRSTIDARRRPQGVAAAMEGRRYLERSTMRFGSSGICDRSGR